MRQHHRTFLCKCPVGQKFGPTFDSKTSTWYELSLSRKQQITWQLSKWTSRVSLSQSTSSNSAVTTKHHFVTFCQTKLFKFDAPQRKRVRGNLVDLLQYSEQVPIPLTRDGRLLQPHHWWMMYPVRSHTALFWLKPVSISDSMEKDTRLYVNSAQLMLQRC